MSQEPGLNPAGKIISIALIAGLILGGYFILKRKPDGQSGPPGQSAQADSAASAPEGVVGAMTEVPSLGPAGPYQMKDNTVDLELSEYAGYAGLLLANGGAEPTENSVFFKNHGFKVRLKFIEEDNWSGLNGGKFAGSATTTDVLAVYGRQLQVTCPLLLGYSRGADGIVVRPEVKRINHLAGRILTAAQFNESDFFIRYLAQEAGLAVNMLDSVDAEPVPEKINLVYCEDADVAGEVFLRCLETGRTNVAGCVTWAPTTTEVVEKSAGKARLLTTNRNLLIVSDVLLLNKAFAAGNAPVVAGLVQGILEGNRQVRANPASAHAVLNKAFKWSPAQCKEELEKIHFANLPENEAYFAGTIDMAGSYGGIFQSAVVAYGRELLPDPAGHEKFMDAAPLAAAKASGKFNDEKISIAPVKTGASGSLENDPLLSKDIRFFFEPNISTLVLTDQSNQQSLKDVMGLLKVSPGSMLKLRGHVDNAREEEFRKEGPEFHRNMAMRAMKLSNERAAEIKRVLVTQHQVAPERIETVGRGWEEPAGTDPEKNRRVEVQWFTLE